MISAHKRNSRVWRRIGCATACAAALVMPGIGGSAQAQPQVSTGLTGNGFAHNNHQPGIGINYLVALQGTYPSRSAETGDITPSGGQPFLGEITMFAGNFAPRNYAYADGQLLPISQYSALYSLYGTTYGGDGRTTFALPDLRGRSAMHQGNGPGLGSYNLGQKGGTDSVALTTAQIPSHTHTVANLDPTTAVGGGQAHTNMKPYQAINYNIALQGIYPSRNAGTGDPSQNSVDPLLGFVEMFGGTFAPRGTASTDGQLLPIASNSALFSLLGTTYGGDGRTTFALPDLRSRLVMHEGQGPGSGQYRSLGEKDGVETVTLTESQIPRHNHTAPAAIGLTGGGQSHANTQPSNTLNYVIALQGLFPSRNADTGDIEQNNSDPFIGEIAMFAGNFAPRGWAFADGQLLAISQNQALFSILGTTYGGDGLTTFALPDLRGRVPVHVGGSRGPGLREWDLGERYGTELETLSVFEMPRHQHVYTTIPGDLSGDGDVDDEDLGLFFAAFTGPDNGPSENPAADLSGDGDVDDEDIGLAFAAFTGPNAPINIPEPGSAALCLLGSAALLVRRRRAA